MTENLQLLAEESCNEAEEEDHGIGACSGSPSPAPLLLAGASVLTLDSFGNTHSKWLPSNFTAKHAALLLAF